MALQKAELYGPNFWQHDQRYSCSRPQYSRAGGPMGILSKKSRMYLKIKTYRTIVLYVVFYGCETWSLILRVERSLRVFGNRTLRRIFGLKRGEVTGEWRKLHI